MTILKRDDLYSLEDYAAIRSEFRDRVMAHKKMRRVPIGPNAALYFEDKLTMHYQIQEMLRIERIFESDAINEELETYNPLIPDGHNWKATFMLEYSDVEERQQALKKLHGIEKVIWVKIGDCDPVYPIANEDLERETEEKTSAVHFLRFEFTSEMVQKAKDNAVISMGISHKYYNEQIDGLENPLRQSLVNDFSEPN
ncbi:MAG: DUF3501 domain-containing protein [Gammaproteobacteria bacterium]|nr:MAG: DUF3501 domain-containing protein [Gammaproteobacteria bacterium]